MLNRGEWKNLRESYWKHVCEELDVYIKSEEQGLRTCKPEDVVKHQEAIKSFETLKKLPDNAIERLS